MSTMYTVNHVCGKVYQVYLLRASSDWPIDLGYFSCTCSVSDECAIHDPDRCWDVAKKVLELRNLEYMVTVGVSSRKCGGQC